MEREFLTQIAERVIIPDILSKTYNPCQATSEDLVDRYHSVIGFLNSEEWDDLADIVFQWSDSQGFHHQKRNQLYNELIQKLSVLPSYDTVEQKLGHDVAEAFLACQEDIDFLNWKEDANRKYTKKELSDLIQIAAIASYGDKEKIISAYENFKRRKRQENQEKRERIKGLNKTLIEKVNDLNIWFPYPHDNEKWMTDFRTKDRGLQFLELVEQVKSLMKKKRCLLQYISKKRLTSKTVEDLDRNMETMTMYLMTYLQ